MLRNLYISFIGFVSIALVVTGCSYRYVAPELQPYTNMFAGIYNINCKEHLKYPDRFVVIFDPAPINTRGGVCKRTSDGSSALVQINRDYWNVINEDLRFSLVFHELSHCLMNSPHSEDINNYMYFQQQLSMSKLNTYSQFVKNVISNCK